MFVMCFGSVSPLSSSPLPPFIFSILIEAGLLLPHSIFFMKDGHAVHGSYEVKNLGKPVSHGCVRISPENATALYALVEENGLGNTQVVLTGVTPGGEFKSARGQAGFGRGRSGEFKSARAQASRGWGFLGRSFSAPYYNEPQAYSGPQWSYSRW